MPISLKPLEQWVCDTCHKVIASPKEGWLEWTDDGTGARGFRIVHQKGFSPQSARGEGCYQYGRRPDLEDMHLDHYVGPEGLAVLLSLADTGPVHRRSLPRVKDLRDWAETVRRLHVPYYEEARQWWGEADADRFFSENDEEWAYLPSTLKVLIERYAS